MPEPTLIAIDAHRAGLGSDCIPLDYRASWICEFADLLRSRTIGK